MQNWIISLVKRSCSESYSSNSELFLILSCSSVYICVYTCMPTHTLPQQKTHEVHQEICMPVVLNLIRHLQSFQASSLQYNIKYISCRFTGEAKEAGGFILASVRHTYSCDCGTLESHWCAVPPSLPSNQTDRICFQQLIAPCPYIAKSNFVPFSFYGVFA